MRLKSASDLDGKFWAVPVAGSTRLNGPRPWVQLLKRTGENSAK